MSLYFSRRAFEEKFGNVSQLQQEFLSSGSRARKLAAPLSRGSAAEFSTAKSENESFQFENQPVDFASVKRIMNAQEHRSYKLRNCRQGDLVVLDSVLVTAQAFPILIVPGKVTEAFHTDLNENQDKFFVFGGLVEFGNLRSFLWQTDRSIFLLGSIDNLQTRLDLIKPVDSLRYPNSYPSSPSRARFLISSLYNIAPGPRERDGLPTFDEALDDFCQMVGRTVTGEGFAYAPDPSLLTLHKQRCRLIASVSATSSSRILLRPIVIE